MIEQRGGLFVWLILNYCAAYLVVLPLGSNDGFLSQNELNITSGM